MKRISLALRLLSAAILWQTLYFKFTGAPESVHIFTMLHAEPYGRLFTGACEFVTGIMLLVPATRVLGLLGAIGLMSGAILSHVFILGFIIQDDGGLLFGLACTVMAAAVVTLRLEHSAAFELLSSYCPRAAMLFGLKPQGKP